MSLVGRVFLGQTGTEQVVGRIVQGAWSGGILASLIGARSGLCGDFAPGSTERQDASTTRPWLDEEAGDRPRVAGHWGRDAYGQRPPRYRRRRRLDGRVPGEAPDGGPNEQQVGVDTTSSPLTIRALSETRKTLIEYW